MKYLKYLLFMLVFIPGCVFALNDNEKSVIFENFKMDDNEINYVHVGYTNDTREYVQVYVNKNGKFSFDIKAHNLDDNKKYQVSLKSDFLDDKKVFTGMELNEGMQIDIMDAKSNVYVTIVDMDNNKEIPYNYIRDCSNYPEYVICGVEPYITTMQIYFDNSRDYTDLDEIYNTIVKDGKIKISAIDLRDDDMNESVISAALQEYRVDGYNITGGCYDGCKMTISSLGDDYKFKQYDVEYEFIEPDLKIKDKVSEYTKKFNMTWEEFEKDINKAFIVEDLENINYKYNNLDLLDSSNSLNDIVNYSGSIHKLLDNDNITLVLDIRAGNDCDFARGTMGPMNFLYDGIVYDIANPVAFVERNIIYVPDDTEITREAFISAATSRIKAYLKDVDVEIVYGGLIEEIDPKRLMYPIEQIVDLEKTTGEWYKVIINGHEFKFLIAQGSDKMNEPFMNTKDAKTDISIQTSSYNVPLDSKIIVDILDINSLKYRELMEKLNIKEGLSIDLKLFSESLKNYITKLEDGKFSVYIPVSSLDSGKQYIAYYLNEDGTKEEHKVKIENGYATFETDHFSTYTLTEITKIDVSENNPQTGDNIFVYVTILGGCLVAIIAFIIYLKHKKSA